MPDPLLILQVFFIMSASTVIVLNRIPAVRSRYMIYGSRATQPQNDDQTKSRYETKAPTEKCNTNARESLAWLLKLLEAIRVPHQWFQHFYIVSVSSSLFWGIQIVAKGSVLETLCRGVRTNTQAKGMTLDQVVLTWSLVAIQGLRRLLETSLLVRSSESKMWFVHWLLGVAFYLALGVSCWIEGAEALLSTNSILSSITLSALNLKVILGIPVFILASGIQHDCHAYLASLPKYTLPVHPIFQSFIGPHYTAECLIYLSLAFIAAPKGALINRTIFSAFIFVSANLAVTAATSKEWYERKFGKDAVANRWILVPGLY